MGIWQAFRMAIKSILSNKFRSFLTMLGVVIGVAAVIAAVGLAQGSTKQITDQISELGTELIQVTIVGRNTNRDLAWETLEEFADENSDVISTMAPQVTSNMNVKAGRESLSTTVRGTTYDYSIINNQGVSEGRFVLDIDSDLRQKVAVIGTRINNELFPDEDALGKTIRMGNQLYTVVGVLEELEAGAESTKDDQIIIPLSTAQRLTRDSSIRNYVFEATSAEDVEEAMERITEFLTDIYGDENMFRVMNSAQMLETLGSVTGTMMIVLGGIAAISLLVGGIGIMNIMMVSVTERTREIGIYKAIGAKRRNILAQFLIEALVVTGLGGIVGLIIGSVAIWGVDKAGVVPSVYSPLWMGLSFGISLIIGVVFGIYPASKASKLNPIAALRHE